MKTLIIALLMSVPSFAFIPSSDYILSQVAKSHGKGAYTFEQEVVFRSEIETVVAREFWTIQDGDTMKVTVKAGTLDLNFVFNDGRVYYAEADGKVMMRKLASESLERYFNARTEKTLSDLLLAAKVVTTNPLRPRPKPHDIKLIKPEVDPFLKMVRLGEDATILISSTQDSKESANSPGIWIDQENYSIRKIRFPSQAEVVATNYQTLSNDLVAPRSRTVTWGANAVEIRLLKSSGLPKNKDLASQFATGSLATTPLEWGNSTLTTQIKEFYQRFR